MFDFVTKHKRLLQVLLALMLIPFAFFGLEAYTRSVGGRDEVASVDGTPITQRELDQALREQRERLAQMFGRDFDLSMVDAPEFRLRVLEALVSDRVMTLEAARSHMVLTREQVIEEIRKAPEFQENGRFSPERYASYLRLRGLSDEGNVEQLRAQAPAARVLATLAASGIQPRAVADRLLELEGQRREVSEAVVPAAAFAGQVKIEEAALKAHYEAHPSEFRIPERVRAQYAVLSAEELARSEPVSEDELKAAFQARAGKLAVPEQRRASHILLKSAEEAARVAAEARKSPQRFAELARRHSQDAGSAAGGGDLGFFGAGDMVKPFSDAVFAMKPGEIAGPVQSDFGHHVIRLDAVQGGKQPGLEEVRAQLQAELGREKAARRYAEAADAFNNLVYEQSDSLKPAADRFRLKLQETDWIAKGAPTDGPLAHPKLVAALFSSDALQQRRNTDAMEVAPGVLVAARVLEHQPESQRKFEEVRGPLAERLRARESAALAAKDGAGRLEALRKGGDSPGLKWGATLTVARRSPSGLSPQALSAVMAADATRLPAFAGVALGERGYAIYRIQRVLAPQTVADEQKRSEQDRLAREAASQEVQSYVAALRARARVQVNAALLEKKPQP